MPSGTLHEKLKQPHPVPTSKAVLISACSIGFLISAILFVFQPFGLYLLEQNSAKTMVIAGYGLITFLIVVIKGIVVPAMAPIIYRKQDWTLGKDLLYDGLLSFLIIGTCNLLYSTWVFDFKMSWGGFLFFQLMTICVGFLPYTVLLLYKHIRLLKQNMEAATALNTELELYKEEQPSALADTILIAPDSGTDKLEISISAFAYAESADNYVKIWYEESGGLKSKMVRLTLKKLEEACNLHPGIVRCHRAYIVNVRFVSSFAGNAQGLRLDIKNSNEAQVPVSRAMVPAIKALLNSTG